MVKIIGLVEGQDPATPWSELKIEVDVGRVLPLEITEAELAYAAAHLNVPARMLFGTPAQPMTATMQAAQQAYFEQLGNDQTELQACRNAWESSDRSVPFPDYWSGWLAASKRTSSLELAMAGFGFDVVWTANGSLSVTGEQSQADVVHMLREARAELDVLKGFMASKGYRVANGVTGSIAVWSADGVHVLKGGDDES